MSYSIQFTPLARMDAKEITDYYKQKQDGLALRFFRQLTLTTRLISQSPALFQKRYKNVRQAPIKKFPFWVHYLIGFFICLT